MEKGAVDETEILIAEQRQECLELNLRIKITVLEATERRLLARIQDLEERVKKLEGRGGGAV